MECISISHKTAGADLRQRFAFAEQEAEAFVRELTDRREIGQAVLLSTCNRTELYVQGETGSFGILEELLARKSEIDAERIRETARRYEGKSAVRHLFSVTCGMDSMVVGEDEILGQVRNAYQRSANCAAAGYEIHAVFQAALACAKRIKTETMISKTSVSVATLAAAEVFHFRPGEKTVLLIGSSGQIGGTILKNLLSRKEIRVLATTRTHRGLYQDGSGRVKNVDYQERYAWLDEADAVISATASPHYTITAGRAKEVMKTEKERLFLDVSVPPDIDAKIGRMKGCRLLAIDDFSRLAAHNNEEKRQAVADAAQILEEEVEELFKALALHNAANRIPEWKKKYEGMPFEKLVYLLRDELNSEAFEALLRALG
ncbi:MAG TPA: glutamyl-tRNA reductase [Candidatus Eisenbergiella pullicola]|nr:glutamyl-tRNA reductase [Candidatus Eisenbergiella pullicola]